MIYNSFIFWYAEKVIKAHNYYPFTVAVHIQQQLLPDLIIIAYTLHLGTSRGSWAVTDLLQAPQALFSFLNWGQHIIHWTEKSEKLETEQHNKDFLCTGITMIKSKLGKVKYEDKVKSSRSSQQPMWHWEPSVGTWTEADVTATLW